MVIRLFLGGGAAGSRRRGSSLVTLFAASLCTAVVATAQAPGGDAAPVETPVPAAAPQEPVAQEPVALPAPAAPEQLGKVVADTVQLQCWPTTTAVPPVFEDTLPKDTVVAIGRSENGFRQILPPLGPIGYVSRKFAAVGDDGVVRSKGTKVAFRYRPKSSEAPVTMLDDGTPLHVIDEQDDWYRCRVPGVDAWVPEAAVQTVAVDDTTLAGYAQWHSEQGAAIQARLDAIAAAKARAAQDQQDLAQVQVVEQAFAQELKRPIAEQRFAPLDEALDKLAAGLATDSAAHAQIAALKKRIETQRWIAEATAVRDSKPEPLPVPPPPPQDELSRFQSIGWLRYERRLGGPGVYYLEKGGRRQCLVSCNTGRYDLALFVDREVGIIGPRRHPAAETLSVLDAERLEVLGVPQ